MKKTLVIVAVSFLVFGCTFGRGFQPARHTSELLVKSGIINPRDNIRAMHMCGLYDGVQYDFNEKAKAYLCLEKAGYSYPQPDGKTECQLDWRKDLPACQPGAVIPKPDPFKAGEFCQSNPSRPECRP